MFPVKVAKSPMGWFTVCADGSEPYAHPTWRIIDAYRVDGETAAALPMDRIIGRIGNDWYVTR